MILPESIDILATPGVGLTVICNHCKGEDRVVLTDRFDTTLKELMEALFEHERKFNH